MLKEEVQRELGALEEDNDEEDEDGESLGEPQRKKRFVANTLLDEEANNIDPNSNADSAELQPHVRRRRMLSTDLLDNTRDQEEPVNLKESVSDLGDIEQSNSLYNMGNFEGESQGSRIVGDNLKAKMLSNQDKFMKEDVLKYVDINNDERLQFENDRNSWMRPQLHSKKSRDFYYPQFQKRSFLNYIPWNAVQKQSRNLNTGVYSYESESEGNSDSRPQPESKTNVELDTSKRTQQFKYNSQPFPKDRTAEKPGYYVYYLGKNQEKKLETPQSSELHSRRNRPMNYQQMRMTYPQFYDNINGLQNKEQFMTANNDDENQKSMTFRIMYKVPAGRRKKRQVTRNFFIPFKDTEDAIVTNTFSESIPGYVTSNNKKKNSTNSNSDPTTKNIINGDGSRILKLKGFINNEKGRYFEGW
ncbi:hypothetical protein WA026_018565 [Henosepilachna vigintioctopunctata]|uniref:Uncharacterized protein n=1 Tax=Henosepilachna vigintioctopunctata TaxID=420089 RepID=A0AAW1UDW7_9CUCU